LISVNSGAAWGDCANVFLEKVQSKYVVIMDPSTRFTGDAITPVVQELQKGEYVAVGWRGGLVNTEDEWRSVDDKGPGEVDVLFSYFMAFTRAAMIEVGGFNPRALYYRNADMEYSLKIRQAGGKLLQMELPLIQERHHGYHDTDPEYRDVQSKKNYDRILDKYRGKSAILSPRR
jgi:GT2 family glycosyltransferase